MARAIEYRLTARATLAACTGVRQPPAGAMMYWREIDSGLALPDRPSKTKGELLAVPPVSEQQVARESAATADQEFAARLASGEAAAMREAVEMFLPQIYASARRLLRNDADAEEVAQETFLRVWKHVGKWTPKGARLGTWVVRIAINLCYDRLRKKSLKANTPLEDAPQQADDAPSAVAGLANQDRAASVARALDNLPGRQQLAIQLVHFDEMSNIDAAAAMDVSVEALESLLARGRRGLKRALLSQKEELLGDMQ